ncbi:MAG: AI-2E family transporter [Christensenellales bacterium]
MHEPYDDKRAAAKSFLYFITYTVALLAVLFNLHSVFYGIGFGIEILSPILGGIAIAYLLNIPLKFLETKVLSSRFQTRAAEKIRRPLCIILCFLPLLLIVCFLIFIVFPQVIESIAALLSKTSEGMQSLISRLEELPDWLGIPEDPAKYAIQLMTDFFQSILSNLEKLFSSLMQILSSASVVLFRSVFSIVLAVHFLRHKERLIKQIRSILTAFLPVKLCKNVLQAASLANKVFGGFLIGQLTEAIILGTLCLLGMLVFQMPYAFLISAIISIGSLIPIIGTLAGTAVSAFILLMSQPASCLWFIIFILILQQIEGSFIYPKVVGRSVGLPGIWVISAFIIGGSLFGFVGVLLGIPTAALLYAVIKAVVQNRLTKMSCAKRDPK